MIPQYNQWLTIMALLAMIGAMGLVALIWMCFFFMLDVCDTKKKVRK